MTTKPLNTIGSIVETIFSGGDSSPRFTVNTGVDSVPLVNPNPYPVNAPHYGILQNAEGKASFENGECINVLSMGLVVPEGFLMSSADSSGEADILKVNLILRNNTNAFVPNVNFPHANLGYINWEINNFPSLGIPYANYEFPYGDFIEPKKATPVNTALDINPNPPPNIQHNFLDDNFEILFTLLTNTVMQNISMLNVPAAYNGKTFYCPFFVKVEHTYPMSVTTAP